MRFVADELHAQDRVAELEGEQVAGRLGCGRLHD